MSEATKEKLKIGWGIDDLTADKLEMAGFLLPKDIKAASDSDLEKAGLTKEKVKSLRVKLPKAK